MFGSLHKLCVNGVRFYTCADVTGVEALDPRAHLTCPNEYMKGQVWPEVMVLKWLHMRRPDACLH